MKSIKEALELVDLILDSVYQEYNKVNTQVDLSFNELENQIDSQTNQDLETLQATVSDEISKDKSDIDIKETITTSIKRLIKEEEYRAFFKRMLKKHNISSPAELSKEKKKEFFKTIEKEWREK